MRADKFNGFSGVYAQRVTKAVFQVEYSANKKGYAKVSNLLTVGKTNFRRLRSRLYSQR